MSNILKRLINKPISRRNFLKGSAAALTLLTLTGCQSEETSLTPTSGTSKETSSASMEETSSEVGIEHSAVTDPEKEGNWITAACWHNCGGRCLNKALVADGVVVRQKTDDTHEDSPDYPQLRACVRGRSQRNHVLAADRLKYPLKRKNWQPGGGDNSNGQLRGIDEWETISWEEAFDYIANETKRIKEEYGNRSIFADGGEVSKMFSIYGGYVPHWGTTSRGAWTYTPGVVGIAPQSNEGINCRMDMRNCEVVILNGVNPAWSSAGNPAYYLSQVKKAGAKFVAIDPYYNDTYSLVDAEWIPCRPSTDTAMLIGVAYAMLKLDETENLIDWDYLNTYCIGFDAEHMPEGANPEDNFKDYLLGTYDNTPKTPEWAEEICGVSADNIRYIARLMSKDSKTAFLCSWGPARTHNADNLPQMVMTIGAMGGHFGKSGHMCGISCHSRSMNGGTFLVNPGSNGLPAITNPIAESDNINDTEMWNAIVDGTYTFAGNSTTKSPGEKKEIDIKMIYHDSQSAKLQTTDGQAKGIEAHRKVEFVVSHSLFYSTNAQFSDIILPLESHWEKPGGFLTGSREMVIYYSQVIERMYECKSDDEIAKGIGQRLGLDIEQVYPISTKQQLFNQLLGATSTDEYGEKIPLLTITDEDISEWECEGEAQEGLIGLKEFIEQGIYQIERSGDDAYGYIAYKDFVDDPQNNPLDTESGKMEIYSQKLKDSINAIGYSQIEAIPTHIVSEEGYEATFKDWETKEKGDYPYQIFNPHYLRRTHTVFDNVQWLRETWPNPVFISAQDAEEKGIESGNTVVLSSPHGKCMRTACVTQRFIPGVVGLPHGAWLDLDEETGICKAGSDNILTGQIQSGQGVSGWNTCICNFEKYSDDPLTPDVELALRIPV